jgi:hypothetical protein
VTDDITPVTGPLTSGGSTNDTDLMVKVSLSGTNAVAGDTVQLYNGTGTGSQLGTSYIITSGDITNGFANVQTGTLSNGTTYIVPSREPRYRSACAGAVRAPWAWRWKEPNPRR